MKRALLTGATGFVGANLVRRLLADGHEVHLLVRESHDPWRLAGVEDDVRLHAASLADPSSVGPLVERVRPDWIFHLAAHGAYPEQRDVRQMVETNVNGTATLLEASLATGFEAFVNAGSSSEYGFKDHPAAEQERVDPNSAYAVTKVAATHLCRLAAVSRDAHVVTLRLYSVYGPYEEPTRLMPALVLRGLRGVLPPLASPDTARDYVFADDVSDAFVRSAAATDVPRGAVYNVGSGVQTSLAEIVEVARRTLSIAQEPVWDSMAARSWDTNVWVSDPSRIRGEVGWSAATPVDEGFRRLVEWFREDEERVRLYESRRGG